MGRARGRGLRHLLSSGQSSDGGRRRGRGGLARRGARSAGAAAAAPAASSSAASPAAAGRGGGGVPYGRRVPEPGLAHLCPVQVTPTAGRLAPETPVARAGLAGGAAAAGAVARPRESGGGGGARAGPAPGGRRLSAALACRGPEPEGSCAAGLLAGSQAGSLWGRVFPVGFVLPTRRELA